MSDGFKPQCNFCTKKNYVDEQDRLVSNQRIYDHKNLIKFSLE